MFSVDCAYRSSNELARDRPERAPSPPSVCARARLCAGFYDSRRKPETRVTIHHRPRDRDRAIDDVVVRCFTFCYLPRHERTRRAWGARERSIERTTRASFWP